MVLLYLEVECQTFEPKNPPQQEQMIFAENMLPLYPGEEKRQVTCEKLREACAKLGAPGAAYRVAEKVLACARRHIS